jgi:hypothetical protein
MVGSSWTTLLLSKIVPAYAGPPERYFRSKERRVVGLGQLRGLSWLTGHTSVLPQVDLHCRRRAGYVSVMRGTGVCDEKGRKPGSGSGASAAYRSPLWLRRGEGVSEEFQAVGERENATLSRLRARLNIPALRFAIGRATLRIVF